MKKLFGMIAIVLLFSSVVFGETTKISETIIKTDHKDWHWFKTGIICVDGYKFVVVTTVTRESDAISIVQFYTNENGNAVAAKC